jgi:hypothetical protein
MEGVGALFSKVFSADPDYALSVQLVRDREDFIPS